MKTIALCAGCGAVAFLAMSCQMGLFEEPAWPDGEAAQAAAEVSATARPSFPEDLTAACAGTASVDTLTCWISAMRSVLTTAPAKDVSPRLLRPRSPLMRAFRRASRAVDALRATLARRHTSRRLAARVTRVERAIQRITALFERAKVSGLLSVGVYNELIGGASRATVTAQQLEP